MIRTISLKVMRVGRATVFLVGLAVILALVFGAASTVSAHTADKGFFHLGHQNVKSAVSKLVGKVAGPSLFIGNGSEDPKATALRLNVKAGHAPLKVNATVGKATNLNADKLDDREASSFADGTGGVANNADKLDGKDSTGFQEAGAAAGGDLSGNYPNPNITNNAVTSTKIQDGQVQNADIANDAVNSAKIANGQVGTADINETQVQRRVSSFCPFGSSIRSVSQTGTVVCDTDGITGHEVVTNSSAYNDIGLKSVTVFCPGNKIAMTGGARYSNSATLIARSGTDGIAIQGDGSFFENIWVQNVWTAEAGYVGSASPPTWRLIVYAVCINP